MPSEPPAERRSAAWLVLLAASAAADVVLSSVLGTACGSGELCGPGDGAVQHAQLGRYLTEVWRQQTYQPGESSVDFWALSIARAAATLALAIAALRSVAAARRPVTPDLLAPLHANSAGSSSADANPALPPATSSPTVSAGARTLSARHGRVVAACLLGTSLLFLSAKAFARLLQSGVEGPGSGTLPLQGTTPQEVRHRTKHRSVLFLLETGVLIERTI